MRDIQEKLDIGLATEGRVAIIGAGIGGLTLALLLQREKIAFDVFDSRAELDTVNVGATVSLAPNCLRLLDYLGVHARVYDRGYASECVNVFDASLKCKGFYCTGNKADSGYSSVRIYRHELVDQMRQALVEHGAGKNLHWNMKFLRISHEDSKNVVFDLLDGVRCKTERALVLVGADGIYSRVRSHITCLTPVYTGALVPMAVVPGILPRPKDQPNFALPASIECKNGSYLIFPQRSDASETLCFRQLSGYLEKDRKGWEALAKDKKKLHSLLSVDKHEWPDYVQELMEAAPAENMTVWAVHELPNLESWISDTGNVILVGDAAHAIPPSSGQGAAQAIEDSYSLGLLLCAIFRGVDKSEALHFWQIKRKERIAKIRDLAKQNYIRRLPEAERRVAIQNKPLIGSLESMRWLHKYDVQDEFASWVSSHDMHEKIINAYLSCMAPLTATAVKAFARVARSAVSANSTVIFIEQNERETARQWSPGAS